MNFCENCNLLVDGERCPKCGNKKVREVQGEDYCFFVDVDAFSCTMLEETLKNNGIDVVCVPFYDRGTTFATAGRANGRHVFVRHKDFENVREIYEELFSSSED